jgi:hypothetical protein
MNPIRMHTKPVGAESEKDHSPGNNDTVGAAAKIQADLTRQMAESVARWSEAYGRSMEIVGKGLEMGLSLINSGGERIINALAAKIAPGPQHVPSPAAFAQTGNQSEPVDQALIGNAIPVVPGSELYVSFSLSNDVPGVTKHIRVSLEPLSGEHSGHPLDISALSIVPAEKSILPLDFEKFVIQGRITDDTIPDRYSGLISVQGDEQFKVRVCFTVGIPDEGIYHAGS